MKKNRLREMNFLSRITIILAIVIIFFIFFRVIFNASAYTTGFLESCELKELQKATIEEGISKDGRLISPKTNEDKKTLYILEMLNHEWDYPVTMKLQTRYMEVDEDEISKRLSVLSKKYPKASLVIDKEDGEKVIRVIREWQSEVGKDAYTESFLEECTEEELRETNLAGIYHKGILHRPVTEEDSIILQALYRVNRGDEQNSEFSYVTFKQKGRIQEKLEVLNRKIFDYTFSISRKEFEENNQKIAKDVVMVIRWKE